MRFKTYRIKSEEGYRQVNIESINSMFESLSNYPKIEEDAANEYAIMYLRRCDELVLGTLVQSYHQVLTKFAGHKGDKKEEAVPDSIINDKTLFYINANTNIVYIQSKRYPGDLNAHLMKKRMEDVFSFCLNKKVVLLETQINNSIEEIEEIFKSSFVRKIAFSNMKGLELPKGSELHNPRKDLDDALVESYNYYSKDTLDYMELKSKDGEDLHKNPFAKIGMILANEYPENDIFKYMDIFESGESIKIKKEGNDSQIISVTKLQHEEIYPAYEKILKRNIKGYTPD